VFQVHGIDAEGKVVVARKLRRKEVLAFFAKLAPCLVGMEACGSAHYWAREIAKLGHSVKLMPPKYVKAYVKRGKTDAGDAAAICEAVTRPSMSFVPVKGLEQQGLSMLHSARRQLIGQRTAPDRNRRHANSALDAGAPFSNRRPGCKHNFRPDHFFCSTARSLSSAATASAQAVARRRRQDWPPSSVLLPRVMVLYAVGKYRRNIRSEAQALQCPQRAHA
jgi:transposase